MQELAYYIRRIAELGLNGSIHQARKTLARHVSSRTQHGMSPCDTLAITGFSSAAELASHLRSRSSPAFFIGRNLDFCRSAIQTYFPAESTKIIEQADRTMQHIFDLLGSGPINLGSLKQVPHKMIGKNGKIQRIDFPAGFLPWHVDFKSRFGWESHTFYKNIRYGHVPEADVKVPWELSRFHHLIPLAQAYCLTQNERYAEEFVHEVSDWIEMNPCHHGVNWACTMEAGIRVVNWIWAFSVFRHSPRIDDAFVLNLVSAFLIHARFIRDNLEFNSEHIDGVTRRLNSNHYLSDIVGLLYIALLFPELKLGADLDFARAELETELFEQTWPDGADYENSTAYHRLVLELFLSGFLLLKKNGYALKPQVQERLQRMGEYVAGYLRPDGTAPQIGDADNGRLHPLSPRHLADHTYLPMLVAEEFDRPDLRVKAADPELIWWSGAVPKPYSTRSRASAAYGGQSFFILRGDAAHVFIAAAPVGMRGFGSHSHNDISSFEYWAAGHAWIVDPGTYVYTPDAAARNHFRSTESHNTVRVDGQEINPFNRNRLFQMSNLARVTVREWKSTSEFDRLDLEHNGYARLPHAVVHRRVFELNKHSNTLTVRDSFEGAGEHVFEWFFHLSPDVNFERDGSRFMLRAGNENARLDISGITGETEIAPGAYSPSYGIKQQASVIAVRYQGKSSFTTSFSIGSETDGLAR